MEICSTCILRRLHSSSCDQGRELVLKIFKKLTNILPSFSSSHLVCPLSRTKLSIQHKGKLEDDNIAEAVFLSELVEKAQHGGHFLIPAELAALPAPDVAQFDKTSMYRF